jgi:hypothetical protein
MEGANGHIRFSTLNAMSTAPLEFVWLEEVTP